MAFDKLKELYVFKRAKQSEINQAVDWSMEWLNYLENNHLTQNIEVLKDYIALLINEDKNTIERLVALARYCYVESYNELYLYFTSLFGSIGVVDEIRKRMIKYVGKVKTEEVFKEIIEPSIGESIDKLPSFTSRLMASIKENMTEDEMKKVLAGNNHQIPVSMMLEEKEYYQKSDNLESYLKERHQRKVDELTDHMKSNKVWFEQIITQEVVDYVSNNQEVLSGVREGNKLLITKIPYDTKAFLEADDDIKKRYQACHCSFARSSILEGNEVDSDWCYCSAGFAKFPFEVIFDRDLDIELLDSPLKGDLTCRFSITIPEDLI